MKEHPFHIVLGKLIPLLGVVVWISGGGMARATTDLLVPNHSTSSVLRYDGVNGATKGVFVSPGSGDFTAWP